MAGDEMRMLAISGSLRKGALNTALLREARSLVPDGCVIDLYDGLAAVPPYNDDVRLAGYPAVVEDLRERVRRADALIFSTPEYNRSYSGVLKNAIDWASRPPEQPFAGKAALVTGVGPGALGTVTANYHLRQVLSVLGVYVLPGMEVLVGGAADKFDGEGHLVHEPTREALRKGLQDLAALATALKPR